MFHTGGIFADVSSLKDFLDDLKLELGVGLGKDHFEAIFTSEKFFIERIDSLDN